MAFSRRQFSSPKEGTQCHKVLQLLIRPQGVSMVELEEIGIKQNSWGVMRNYLTNICGYHIEKIGRAKPLVAGAPPAIFKAKHRIAWSGQVVERFP